MTQVQQCPRDYRQHAGMTTLPPACQEFCPVARGERVAGSWHTIAGTQVQLGYSNHHAVKWAILRNHLFAEQSRAGRFEIPQCGIIAFKTWRNAAMEARLVKLILGSRQRGGAIQDAASGPLVLGQAGDVHSEIDNAESEAKTTLDRIREELVRDANASLAELSRRYSLERELIVKIKNALVGARNGRKKIRRQIK